jgi:hypothetical protein
MAPAVLCLIVLAMPFAVAASAAFAAWREQWPVSAKADQLFVGTGDGLVNDDDDSTLF